MLCAITDKTDSDALMVLTGMLLEVILGLCEMIVPWQLKL